MTKKMQMTCLPKGFEYTLIEFPLGSLYYTTLLSNLNSRKYIRGRKADWSEYMSTSGIKGTSETVGGAGPIVLSTLKGTNRDEISRPSQHSGVMVKSERDVEIC
jgi:hypothetical protein